MKCHAGVKRCAWSFGGCIITRLDVGRNAERKYAVSGSVFRAAYFMYSYEAGKNTKINFKKIFS